MLHSIVAEDPSFLAALDAGVYPWRAARRAARGAAVLRGTATVTIIILLMRLLLLLLFSLQFLSLRLYYYRFY